MSKREVTKEEMHAYAAAYPGKLTFGSNMITDPPALFYETSQGKIVAGLTVDSRTDPETRKYYIFE